MPYLTPLAMRRIRTDVWELTEDLVYEGRDDRFTTRAGKRTDLASSPRAFQALVPRMGPWDCGAVTHDDLCDDLRRYYDEVRDRDLVGLIGHSTHLVEPPLASARDTDAILRRIIREYHEAGVGGCGPVTQWSVWAAVRWGAVANPARRAGWWRDAPAVLAITAAALAVAVAALLALGWIVAVLLGL